MPKPEPTKCPRCGELFWMNQSDLCPHVYYSGAVKQETAGLVSAEAPPTLPIISDRTRQMLAMEIKAIDDMIANNKRSMEIACHQIAECLKGNTELEKRRDELQRDLKHAEKHA